MLKKNPKTELLVASWLMRYRIATLVTNQPEIVKTLNVLPLKKFEKIVSWQNI